MLWYLLLSGRIWVVSCGIWWYLVVSGQYLVHILSCYSSSLMFYRSIVLQVVKEQKGRITELMRSKQEQATVSKVSKEVR